MFDRRSFGRGWTIPRTKGNRQGNSQTYDMIRLLDLNLDVCKRGMFQEVCAILRTLMPRLVACTLNLYFWVLVDSEYISLGSHGDAPRFSSADPADGADLVMRLLVAGSSPPGHLIVFGRISPALCWRAKSASMPTRIMHWRGSLEVRNLGGPSILHPKDDRNVTVVMTR